MSLSNPTLQELSIRLNNAIDACGLTTQTDNEARLVCIADAAIALATKQAKRIIELRAALDMAEGELTVRA